MLELSDASSKTIIKRSDYVMALQIAAQAIENCTEGGGKTAIPVDLQMRNGAEETMLQTNEKGATRVLVLLLDNAQRFTKEGSIRLILDKQENEIRFIVEDTGIGVPPEEAEHIFEEFVQLDDYYDGTGIGLTVARSISRRLGGDVVLDTSYTGGARFVATLPIGDDTTPQSPQATR
jgi:signal transduction histidine kinase